MEDILFFNKKNAYLRLGSSYLQKKNQLKIITNTELFLQVSHSPS